MGREKITVNSRKYNQVIGKTWLCDLIEQGDNLLVLAGEFEREVEHLSLGKICKGTISFEYFWLDRWYNIFRFHEPDGSLRNYYCNVAMPPTFENGVLDYIDLDIDILVWPDRRYEVVDRDDFRMNALKYDYPDEIRQRAEESVSEILTLIDRDELPTNTYHHSSFCDTIST